MKEQDRARASDPTTPPEVLEKLAGRYANLVAANPNANAATLGPLSVDYRPGVAEAVLNNPSLALICLESPARGMQITGQAMSSAAYVKMARLFKKVSKKGACEWALRSYEHVLDSLTSYADPALIDLSSRFITTFLSYLGGFPVYGEVLKIQSGTSLYSRKLYWGRVFELQNIIIHISSTPEAYLDTSDLLQISTLLKIMKTLHLGRDEARAYIEEGQERQWQLSKLQEIIRKEEK